MFVIQGYCTSRRKLGKNEQKPGRDYRPGERTHGGEGHQVSLGHMQLVFKPKVDLYICNSHTLVIILLGDS